MTALILARMQFAFTVSFHFLFPAFSIGLASYLAVLEGLWLKTGKGVYANLFRYWLKIFAVVFAMGVVSGIVMSYQFGTNWSVFSDKAGPVIGPLMAYEVLTAFFLEAGFLGVMLFGINKVGRKLHFTATLAVAVGTFISAFWILSVNSWMQTPAGYELGANGQFLPGPSWLPIIFNPSFPYRLVHTVLAAYLTTAFAVGGVGAWHLLKDRANPGARKMFSMAMWMAALVAPVQIFAGDLHGLNTLEHQPIKVMAMEGHYDSHPDGAPLILLGIPNSQEKRVDYAIEIPKGSSLILKHDPDAPLKGLDTVPDADEPPVGIVFWAFRIMVGLGFAMFGLGLYIFAGSDLPQEDKFEWKGRVKTPEDLSKLLSVLDEHVQKLKTKQEFNALFKQLEPVFSDLREMKDEGGTTAYDALVATFKRYTASLK